MANIFDAKATQKGMRAAIDARGKSLYRFVKAGKHDKADQIRGVIFRMRQEMTLLLDKRAHNLKYMRDYARARRAKGNGNA